MLPDAWLRNLAPETEWGRWPVHSIDGHSKAGRAHRASQGVLKALVASVLGGLRGGCSGPSPTCQH